MFIIPMSGITPLQTPSQTAAVSASGSGSDASFTDVFKQAVENVEETQRITAEDSVKVVLGEVDDLHTVQINMKKAATALEVLVTMKNTAVDAYNEIMRMSI
ncbi:MAG: flagellar hook-basal body complex protein FliE [Oscillospiraceae bacterium]|jgi:flagellar hook-basal body complex protein FliE